MRWWIFLAFFSSCLLASDEPKEFIVIIPSHNNSLYAERNLTSVLSQNYPHFHLIYIDDCSTDDTFAKAQEMIQKQGKQNQVTLVHNEQRQGALANIYHTIQSCADESIIVLVDGDDWLAHPEVLSRLNAVYQDENIWVTYGSYQEFPSGVRGFNAEQIPFKHFRENSIRKIKFTTSHLRTFYAKLFKKISMQDLYYQGEFFTVAWDLAFMYPLIEMARLHSKFLPDIHYIYNRETMSNDDKLKRNLVIECAAYIRSLPPYRPLHQL